MSLYFLLNILLRLTSIIFLFCKLLYRSLKRLPSGTSLPKLGAISLLSWKSRIGSLYLNLPSLLVIGALRGFFLIVACLSKRLLNDFMFCISSACLVSSFLFSNSKSALLRSKASPFLFLFFPFCLGTVATSWGQIFHFRVRVRL